MGNKSEGKKLMALKLDMKWAYDRMKWGFLEKVMEKFGFAGKFIELIMGCICDPSFVVLVNGTSTSGSSPPWASRKATHCHHSCSFWGPKS